MGFLSLGDRSEAHFQNISAHRNCNISPTLIKERYHSGNICSLDFHRAKHLILTAGDDRATKVFDLDNKKVIATYKQSSMLQKSPKIKAAYFLVGLKM